MGKLEKYLMSNYKFVLSICIIVILGLKYYNSELLILKAVSYSDTLNDEIKKLELEIDLTKQQNRIYEESIRTTGQIVNFPDGIKTWEEKFSIVVLNSVQCPTYTIARFHSIIKRVIQEESSSGIVYFCDGEMNLPFKVDNFILNEYGLNMISRLPKILLIDDDDRILFQASVNKNINNEMINLIVNSILAIESNNSGYFNGGFKSN